MPTPPVRTTANGPVPRLQPAERCKPAVVRLTTKGRVVLGQTNFERDAPNINGTVDENGTFGGTLGFQPMRGQFMRDELEVTFKSFDCEWKVLLRRTR